MLLRAAINSRTEEAVKRLYSWSFLWSCRLWANVLAGGVEAGIGGRESTLKPLVYPLVQVLLGVMRFVRWV
jgi:nucleolar complex protein 2